MKIQEKRGDFEYENWYLKFKSLNLGTRYLVVYYWIFIMDQGHYPLALPTYINVSFFFLIFFLFKQSMLPQLQ